MLKSAKTWFGCESNFRKYVPKARGNFFCLTFNGLMLGMVVGQNGPNFRTRSWDLKWTKIGKNWQKYVWWRRFFLLLKMGKKGQTSYRLVTKNGCKWKEEEKKSNGVETWPKIEEEEKNLYGLIWAMKEKGPKNGGGNTAEAVHGWTCFFLSCFVCKNWPSLEKLQIWSMKMGQKCPTHLFVCVVLWLKMYHKN